MTKRQFWLKLFNENSIALASAIHLCERFVTQEQLKSGEHFIKQKLKELDEPMTEDAVKLVFGELLI
jgi:outer membrane protein assembly factor BamE (lipoprotein component of BamABCDE complex)